MGKGGKSKGKIAFTLIGVALGGYGAVQGWWGVGIKFSAGAMYGASIASTL